MRNTSPLPESLARIHTWARNQPWLGRFTLMCRLLLFMGFFPTGLVKATGHRFTTLPVENPVGFFFEAMYQTGPYWYFIGIMQIAAAVFLIIPATATLGALLFFPHSWTVPLLIIGGGAFVLVVIGWIVQGVRPRMENSSPGSE